MRRHPRSALLGAAALVCLVAAHGGLAEPSEGRALLARAFENLYGDDYVQTLELETRDGDARPHSKKLQVTRKQSVRPGKALVRFLEPYDVRRTSILILEREKTNDDLFVYLPAVRITRRVSAAQRADSFFGTDLSYEDVEPKRAGDYEVRIIPGEEGEGCVRLDLTTKPGIDSTYERMISCVEPERGVIRWTEFYRGGKPVKRLEIEPSSVRPIEGRFIPFAMTMRTHRTGSQTRVLTERYELVEEIPDSLFSAWNLEAGDAARDRARAPGRRTPEP